MFYTWEIDDPEASMPPSRRFPPPWSVDELEACGEYLRGQFNC
jgi:hypothetical protein